MSDQKTSLERTVHLIKYGNQLRKDFRQNSEKMRRTIEDVYTKAWLDYCRCVFPQSVRKTGPDVNLCHVSTYQCSILFNKVENIDKSISFNEKFNVVDDPQLSLLTKFL